MFGYLSFVVLCVCFCGLTYESTNEIVINVTVLGSGFANTAKCVNFKQNDDLYFLMVPTATFWKMKWHDIMLFGCQRNEHGKLEK